MTKKLTELVQNLTQAGKDLEKLDNENHVQVTTQAKLVGQKLAAIGDSINDQYQNNNNFALLKKMITSLLQKLQDLSGFDEVDGGGVVNSEEELLSNMTKIVEEMLALLPSDGSENLATEGSAAVSDTDSIELPAVNVAGDTTSDPVID